MSKIPEPTRRYATHPGFTLVELLVGMVVGLFVASAVVMVFVESNRSFGQDRRLHQLQESGRFALQLLAEEVAMAGFWGSADPPKSAIAMSGTDCGLAGENWGTDTGIPLQYSAGGSPSSEFSCLASAVAGTHALAVKRARGAVSHDSGTAAVSGDAGKLFVRATGAGSTLILYDTADLPTTGERDREYWAAVYYIDTEAGISGQANVPVLHRMVLSSGTPAMVKEQSYLAEGIERFVIEFGVDDDADALPDRYTSTPSADDLENAVSARVWVLARSSQPDSFHTDDKVYALGATTVDHSVAPDNFYRRVFTTTVQLRNVIFRKRLSNL